MLGSVSFIESNNTAKSGLPIYEVTLTGEKADVSSLINFLDKINSWFSLKNSKILADKGFDSKANYNYIKDVLHSEAFIAKNKHRVNIYYLLHFFNLFHSFCLNKIRSFFRTCLLAYPFSSHH